MLIGISTLVLAIIGVGWFFRPLIVLAFSLDVGMLLYIEGTRHALHTLTEGLQAPTHHGLLLFHVLMSLLMLLLYLTQITSGFLLYRNRANITSASIRHFHRFSAIAFLLCRGANYITSFFVVQHT